MPTKKILPFKPTPLKSPSQLTRLEAVTDTASKQITKLSSDLAWYSHALNEKSAWANEETDRADSAETKLFYTKGLCITLAIALLACCTSLAFR